MRETLDQFGKFYKAIRESVPQKRSESVLTEQALRGVEDAQIPAPAWQMRNIEVMVQNLTESHNQLHETVSSLVGHCGEILALMRCMLEEMDRLDKRGVPGSLG